MGTPDHLTCLIRNLYESQAQGVKTEYGTLGWFKIGKEVCQSCILPPCLFNFYANYIIQNAALNEAQVGNQRLLGEILIISDMPMIPL